ncbi:MAG: aspartate aminotransferase family protein [Spirochaetes bacterium]|nr:MAG: aspartate aminotransferase family protein [Spirochaetota bacterium]
MTSRKLQAIIDEDREYLFQNYGDRLPVCFVRGEGAYLYDQDDRRYLDFFCGIAVTSLGHGLPAFSKKLHAQLGRIIHTSNWFYNREQAAAARLVSTLAFKGRTLFVNSGTEANEAAIKLARRYGQETSPEKYEIISFEGSFHGRTFGGMSATAQEKIRKGFGPIVPGFKYLPFNDTAALEKELSGNPRVCAVITELVQGEGGIRIADTRFVKSMIASCKRHGAISIIDEVQTGVGRTGTAFAYQHYGVTPDVITLAKGLGGGIPVGALHARGELMRLFEKGAHGTTFGGNHFACAAVEAVLKELAKPAMLKKVRASGEYIMKRMNDMAARYPVIREVRGLGLHIGVELAVPGAALVKKALERGLVINCTADRVIRIMPPLTIGRKAIDEGLVILEKLLSGEVEKP